MTKTTPANNHSIEPLNFWRFSLIFWQLFFDFESTVIDTVASLVEIFNLTASLFEIRHFWKQLPHTNLNPKECVTKLFRFFMFFPPNLFQFNLWILSNYLFQKHSNVRNYMKLKWKANIRLNYMFVRCFEASLFFK